MAASAGKTIGLILLVIFIIFLSVRLTPLILAPLGIFTGPARVIHGPDFSLGGWLYRWNSANLFSLALLFIWIAVIIWVYRDAERRGMNGVLWALLVLIGNLIALIIYLIVRSDNISQSREGPAPKVSPPLSPPAPTTADAAGETRADAPCPKCGKPVALEFAYCPHCGSPAKSVCPECGNDVESEWKACPRCGKILKED